MGNIQSLGFIFKIFEDFQLLGSPLFVLNLPKYEKIEDLEEKEVHPLSVKKENFSCNILFVYGKNSLPISEIPL